MTLPSSGPLSISQIAGEFGVALPCVFPDAFYGKPGVPASGTLSLSQFYGLSNVLFSPDGGTISDSSIGTSSLTLYCTVPATWTFSLPPNVSASIASGATSPFVTFSLPAPGVGIRARSVSVSGVASGILRSFSVELEANGGGV